MIFCNFLSGSDIISVNHLLSRLSRSTRKKSMVGKGVYIIEELERTGLVVSLSMLPGVEFARRRRLHQHQASSSYSGVGGHGNIHRSKGDWACQVRLPEEQRQKMIMMMDTGSHVSDVVIHARRRLDERLYGGGSFRKDALKDAKEKRNEKGRRKLGDVWMITSEGVGCFLLGRVPVPICLF